jgi:hypothetical protein
MIGRVRQARDLDKKVGVKIAVDHMNVRLLVTGLERRDLEHRAL